MQIFDQHILVLKKSTELRPQEDMKILEFSQVLDAIFNPLINLLRHVADKLPEDKAALLAVNSYSYMLVNSSRSKPTKSASSCHQPWRSSVCACVICVMIRTISNSTLASPCMPFDSVSSRLLWHHLRYYGSGFQCT